MILWQSNYFDFKRFILDTISDYLFCFWRFGDIPVARSPNSKWIFYVNHDFLFLYVNYGRCLVLTCSSFRLFSLKLWTLASLPIQSRTKRSWHSQLVLNSAIQVKFRILAPNTVLASCLWTSTHSNGSGLFSNDWWKLSLGRVKCSVCWNSQEWLIRSGES